MLIQKKLIKDMDRAAYNPRVDLRPGDDEYEALKDSLTEFGLVIPIIWNQRTNRVVGGHQRLTVEENLGHTEVYVSVVNLDEMQEKQLNIALNKAQGAWDDGKLAELMNSLGNRAQDTGLRCRKSKRSPAVSRMRWTKTSSTESWERSKRPSTSRWSSRSK